MEDMRNVQSATICSVVACVLGLSSIAVAGPTKSKQTSPAKENGSPEEPKEAREVSDEATDGRNEAGAAATLGAASRGTERVIGPRDTIIFIDAGFRNDQGSFSRSERVGRNETNENDDISSWGLPLHVGLLSKLDENWRIGGAFGYGFNYDTNNRNGLLGQLLTLDMRLEYTAPLTGAWWLIGGPKMGLSSIIPGGLLQDRITENQQVGYSTLSGPRLGFLVGADLGTRYQLLDWLAIRATLGYLYSMNFLLNSSASSGELSASQSWTATASRFSLALGAEVSF